MGITYREAGVDIDAAADALVRIKAHAQSTFGAPDAAAPIGHFGGIFRLPAGGDRLLVSSTDSVGTKLKLAFIYGGDAHARVGADLVNHCVNDILACGARPLFFLDYVGVAKVDGDVLDLLIGGIAAACRENGVALVGGETAELPGIYHPGEYDVAGFVVGIVEPDHVIDGRAVRDGDLLIGLPSDGLHTNGYSLARKIVGLSGDLEDDRLLLDRPLPNGEGQSIGDALLRPHRTYLPAVMPLVERGMIRGMAHITGGGLTDNVPRMIPNGLAAKIDRTTWTPDPIFTYLVAEGQLSLPERYRALNMGIGFVLAVVQSDAEYILATLPDAVVIGSVIPGASEQEATVHFDFSH